MKSNITSTNISFNFLEGSSDFLNLVIGNINSCVLLLNKRMELQAFNDSLKTIFSDKKDEHILYHRCGEVIGCAFSVEEEKDCGTTSQCQYCELRESALNSYLTDENFYKEKISRHFYTASRKKVLKHLQFSTRSFAFQKDKYIIMIIEDITKFINQQEQIQNQLEHINNLEYKN